MWKQDTIILNKTQELTQFLLGKSELLDLVDPARGLKGRHSQDLRERILALSIEEARALGIGRCTFHDLRQLAAGERPLIVCKGAADKLLGVGRRLEERLALQQSDGNTAIKVPFIECVCELRHCRPCYRLSYNVIHSWNMNIANLIT